MTVPNDDIKDLKRILKYALKDDFETFWKGFCESRWEEYKKYNDTTGKTFEETVLRDYESHSHLALLQDFMIYLGENSEIKEIG